MTALYGLGTLAGAIAINVVILALAGMRRDHLSLREWWRS